MSAQKEIIQPQENLGNGKFGWRARNALHRFTELPQEFPIISRKDLLNQVIGRGQEIHTQMTIAQLRVEAGLGLLNIQELRKNPPRGATPQSMAQLCEINAKNQFLLQELPLPKKDLWERTKALILGNTADRHLLAYATSTAVRTQLGLTETIKITNYLLAREAFAIKMSILDQLTQRITNGKFTSPTLFYNFVRQEIHRRVVPRSKHNVAGIILGTGAVLGVGALALVGYSHAQVPDEGTPVSHLPTLIPTGTHTPEATKTTAAPTNTPYIEATPVPIDGPAIIICPSLDGSNTDIPPSILTNATKITHKDVQTIAGPDQQAQLADLYAAIHAKNFGKDVAVLCTPNNANGAAGVSYFVRTVPLRDLEEGVNHSNQHLFVYMEDHRGLVGLTEDRFLTPQGNGWLTEQNYTPDHFVVGQPGSDDHFDGALYYKVDPKTGFEYVAGVLSFNAVTKKFEVLTGQPMVDKFAGALSRTPYAMDTTPTSIKEKTGVSVTAFGYEPTKLLDGQIVFRLVGFDESGIKVWPADAQQTKEINQSIKTNNIFIELMASYDEKTQQGTIEIKSKDGKIVKTMAVTLSTASVDTPDFAYAYSNDGTRIFVFNEKRDGLVEIPVEQKVKIEKIKNENVTNRDTKEKEWQLSDGIFYYDKESKRWLSAPGIHIKTGENWKTRNEDIVNWATNVKITGFSKADEGKIRSALTKLAPKIVKVPLPDFVVSKDPNIRNEPLMEIDPGAFFPLVGEIKAKSTGTASADWRDRASGVVYLNLKGILGAWSEDFLQFFTVDAIVKEASVIALHLLANEAPCLSDKQSPGVLTRTEREWNSVRVSVGAYLALAKAYPERKDDLLYVVYGPKKDDPAFKDKPEKFAKYYSYSLKYLFEHPEKFPQCGF